MRALLEFAADIRIPGLDMRLGAAGIGTSLPEGCSAKRTREIISALKRRLERQNGHGVPGIFGRPGGAL